jgi:hypothetical protein
MEILLSTHGSCETSAQRVIYGASTSCRRTAIASRLRRLIWWSMADGM